MKALFLRRIPTLAAVAAVVAISSLQGCIARGRSSHPTTTLLVQTPPGSPSTPGPLPPGVEAALMKINGCEKVEPAPGTEAVRVRYDPTRTTPKALAQAVRKSTGLQTTILE